MMLTLIARVLRSALAVLVCVASLTLPPRAEAQVANIDVQLKIAPDLRATISASTTAIVPWATLLNGRLLVKVLVTSNSDDQSLTALRNFVLSLGGSVYYNYASLRMLAVMVPASQLLDLANRTDVASISPNRAVTRTASLLQLTTGASVASTPNRRTLDGSGVGIAVVDSGIAYSHQSVSGSLLGLRVPTRVHQAIDFVQLGKGLTGLGWIAGVDLSAAATVTLDGTKFTSSLSLLQQPRITLPDRYGHGSHVASIAAGSGAYQWPDTSGVAPNADLYDVRVLNENGVGNIADVIAGIDWVIQHARLLNIRVMNLSLAAGSTESFITDPLARAARRAVATGIVVVVAAGNAGKTADGREIYGAVGSPGHDPSVITVGATNLHGTAARSDDTVAGFGSRGPTRGRAAMPEGPWIDNLLKPDLVAPGNRIVGALSADIFGQRSTWNRLVTTYPQLANVPGATQAPNQTLMQLSGTSVAAPVVAGAAALLLQANPGLTPPLIKAILQYTAQPLPGANLLEQGVGELNIEGAVRLAAALRTDIGPALAAGRLHAGDPLLATGQRLPLPRTSLNGQTFNWGRLVELDPPTGVAQHGELLAVDDSAPIHRRGPHLEPESDHRRRRLDRRQPGAIHACRRPVPAHVDMGRPGGDGQRVRAQRGLRIE
jgi:subtilisin family serine protease